MFDPVMTFRAPEACNIRSICDYIREHLREELTHAHLIERLGVTRHVLVTNFPKQTGMTVTAYIIYLRQNRAIELINSGMKMEEAAYTAGFRTYTHFYKTFVKRFGVSPKKYFKTER